MKKALYLRAFFNEMSSEMAEYTLDFGRSLSFAGVMQFTEL